ncbi:hypothetical protein M9H77_06561 [Catharanthus roseus]|uniref:Uncharacterized protein n=1 Tax=Catharanthus roseus TaxID=4058 RepID=A0ACC0BSP1_CATRO|nr:hypothetical protein M9H77_06561 [Catharanthus roseus]
MKLHPSARIKYKRKRYKERDRGRRLPVIPSRLRPFPEGYNPRSYFSLPSTPRRGSAAARRPFSRVVFSNKWYQSRGSGSSAPASDSNLSDLRSFSDPASEFKKLKTDRFDGKSDFVMWRRKMKAVLVQNKIAPTICSSEEYPESWKGEILKEKTR